MTSDFDTKRLPAARDVVAPDGSDVRVLLTLDRGGMAHFALAPGRTSTAVTHRTVEEIWFVLTGTGEMWRRQGAREEIVPLLPGVCLTIPLGTHFQFRASGAEPLAAVGVTMPPWPGESEAMPVQGKWDADGSVSASAEQRLHARILQSDRRGGTVARRLISSGSTFEKEIGYSRAVVDGDWIFVSGTTGFDYASMTIADGIVEQTDQCLRNIESALTQAGAALRDVVRVTYVVPNPDDFPQCWPTLRRYFGDVRPAAMMISAGLADPRMRIEIEVTARRPTAEV